MPQVILISGFLGAGKTSLLQAMLAQPGLAANTAIIVNEFGQVGVDGAVLREGCLDVVELANGCLCCTLRGATETALAQLLDKPGIERIVIEASGAAVPTNLVDCLEEFAVEGRLSVGPIIGVIDSSRYIELDRTLGEFLDAQIRNSNVIVLNKADIADGDQLETVRLHVERLHAGATIIATAHGRLDREVFAPQAADPMTRHVDARTEPDPHATFRSVALQIEEDLPAGMMERSFSPPIRGLVRAKGFVQIEGRSFLLQFDGETVRLSESEPRRERQLVFIGQDLDEAEIERRFFGLANRLPTERWTNAVSFRAFRQEA